MELELSTKLGELLARSQDGDLHAYDEFLFLSYDLVERAVVAKLQINREDVVQEILLSIHKARHSYNSSREFYPWFYAIVNARVVDEKRKSFREGRKMEAYRKEVESIEIEDSRKKSLESDISGVLQALPEKERNILELNKVHGYSMKEIADYLGISLENVKVTAHRGLNNLKSVFKDKSDG